MRFLFVYETAAGEARDLLNELLVTDVHVVVARRGELQPRAEDMAILQAHAGAEAAACQLNRKYRKNVIAYVAFTVEPKKFRIEDQLLREWLLGGDREEGGRSSEQPKVAFERAAEETPALVVHSNGLARANELDESRWAFAAKAAALLSRQASGGESLGPFREWGATQGVAFAANGQVTFRYKVEVGDSRSDEFSQWHLKAGDRTTADRAARIYFTVAQVGGLSLVLVAYVGPHPSDGTYTVDFGRIDPKGITG